MKQYNTQRQVTQLLPRNHATHFEVSQGQQTLQFHRYGFLLVCYCPCFSDIRLQKMLWLWNPGQRS